MKRILYIFLCLFLSIQAQANPGDTTWVQAHNDKWLDYYNNFDTAVQFPDGSKTYRKVIMIFTVGKYQCPGTPQYCGDWDYTVQNYIMNSKGDTVEISRLITPYANATAARTPWGWKERYVFDVTDYISLLKDAATVRIHYSGYSGGFTANIRFAFIEGTPARTVTGFHQLWDGSYKFGDANDPINNHTMPATETAPASTQFAELKFRVTGHGSDNSGCSEFCKKYYEVKLNGNTADKKDIWRDNCGYNHLYPQSGTWPYDRGNWCPGDLVLTNSHKLTGIAASSNYNVGVEFESHSSSGGSSYTLNGAVVYYGAYNHSVDASLEDIIAPNNHEMYYRQNPRTGSSVIKVKNTGSSAITSLKIQYGIAGKPTQEYTWSGSLASLEDAEITLPSFQDMYSATGINTFNAKILQVNGQADEDATNDALSSSFNAAPVWPTNIVLKLKTNHAVLNGESETSWWIIRYDNDTVAKRVHNAADMTYEDTLTLWPSFYHLVVSDAGCDGLSFWNNKPAGSGSLTMTQLGEILPTSIKPYFGGDFGCGFTHYFTTWFPTDVKHVRSGGNAQIAVYPNPASDHATLIFEGVNVVKGSIQVLDATGKILSEQYCNAPEATINTASLASGVYQVVFTDEQTNQKLQTRLVIAK